MLKALRSVSPFLRFAWNEDQPRDDDGKFGDGSGGGSGPVEGTHAVSGSAVNSAKMLHTTSDEAAASISENGFGFSSNAVYGKAVYFTDKQLPNYGSTSIEVTLEPHQQLKIDSDTDAPRIFAEITGMPQSAVTFSDKFPAAMVSAGYGSAQFKVDDQTYTLVFDPGLIKLKPRSASHRSLRLHIETGAQIRTASFRGKDHVVVPVVALKQGVIQASNASTPELVLASEFSKNVELWNSRPVMLDHPTRDGAAISANAPDVLEGRQIGVVFGARVDEAGLKMEAWLDPDMIEAADAGELVDRLRAGDTVDVSVGVVCSTEASHGTYKGASYVGVWRDVRPDHLAMLPIGVEGACSIEMGCGGPRAAGYNPDQPRDDDGKFGDGGGADSGAGEGFSHGSGWVEREDKGLREKTPSVGYHTTDIENLESIAEKGLLPSATHPGDTESIALRDKLPSKGKDGAIEELDDFQVTFKVDVPSETKAYDDLEVLEALETGGGPNSKIGTGTSFFAVGGVIPPENIHVIIPGSRKTVPIREYVERLKSKKGASEGGGMKDKSLKARFLELIQKIRTAASVDGEGVNELRDKLTHALFSSVPAFLSIVDIYPEANAVVYCAYGDDGEHYFRASYTADGEDVTVGDGEPVELTIGYEPMTVASAPGCGCDGKTKNNAVGKDDDMKSKLIAKILARKGAQFTSDDAAYLETLSEARLTALSADVEEPVKEDEPEPKKEEVKAAEPLTEEKVLSMFPRLAQMSRERETVRAARKAELLTSLKDAAGYTGDELKAKEVEELEKLATLAGKAPKIDYSGNGVPATPPADEQRIAKAPGMRDAILANRGIKAN